jgi:GDP-D-mannose dehydratase
MWRIVQSAEPGDYVIATGDPQCPRATEIAFAHVG